MKSDPMSGRLDLRDVQEADLPTLFEHQREPEANRMAAFPPRERDAFMAHWAKVLADTTAIKKSIVLDGAVVGNVVCWESRGRREVGYWIGKEHWGKGIASAALAKFLTQVGLRPLYAHVAKHNAASIRVLEKCGFAVAGEDRGAAPTGGEVVEEVILMLP
jgi:RimJ/RimL family protein N-acetyltransferase